MDMISKHTTYDACLRSDQLETIQPYVCVHQTQAGKRDTPHKIALKTLYDTAVVVPKKAEHLMS